MDNSIIVKYQEADILVKNYSKDITAFKEDAKKQIAEIRANVSAMGRDWAGDIYDSFKNNINSQLAKMEKNLNELDQLTPKLDLISKKFTDVINYAKNNLGQGR